MVANLQAIRKARGLTQGELAQAAQINRVTIAKYEAGKVDPTMKSAERLANALGVTINDLIRREDDEAASDHRADS